MKTKEELNAIKTEVEALSRKLANLTDEELEQVTGGQTNSANNLRKVQMGFTVEGQEYGEISATN